MSTGRPLDHRQGTTLLIFELTDPDPDGGDPLLPLDSARAGLLRALEPVVPEMVSTGNALGLILARSVHAWEDLPPRSIALAEGYAVASLDTVGAGPYAPLVMMVPPRPVWPGSPLPGGCDAVLPLHAVEGDDGLAEVVAQATPGENVRRAGEDARAGEELVPAGRVLGPLEQALALAAGVDEVLVRRPRVALVGRDGPALALMAGLVIREGGLPVTVSGSEVLALAVLMGPDHDGFDPVAAGVALRPGGEGVTLGRFGRTPAMAIGPRPEHALAAGVALLRPAIRHLTQARPTPPVVGRLAGKIVSPVGSSDVVVFAVTDAQDGTRTLTPLGTGDLPWSKLGMVDAVAIVESGSEGFPPGATISAELL